MKQFSKLLVEKGITHDVLLDLTKELMEAIKVGTYSPKDKNKELEELRKIEKDLVKKTKRHE